HSIPADDYRMLRPCQQRRGCGDAFWVRTIAAVRCTGSREAQVSLLVNDVTGQRQKNGATWRILSYFESPWHNHRDLLHVLYLDSPFDQWLCHGHQVVRQNRLTYQHATVLLTRRH